MTIYNNELTIKILEILNNRTIYNKKQVVSFEKESKILFEAFERDLDNLKKIFNKEDLKKIINNIIVFDEMAGYYSIECFGTEVFCFNRYSNTNYNIVNDALCQDDYLNILNILFNNNIDLFDYYSEGCYSKILSSYLSLAYKDYITKNFIENK